MLTRAVHFQGGGDAGAAAGMLHVSIAAKATTVCPGECVTLTPSATGGTPPVSYQWSPAGSGSGTWAPIQVCPEQDDHLYGHRDGQL